MKPAARIAAELRGVAQDIVAISNAVSRTQGGPMTVDQAKGLIASIDQAEQWLNKSKGAIFEHKREALRLREEGARS